MRVAMFFGLKCSTYLPPTGFDIDGLYDRMAMTGSESGFFNIAWGLSERGHQVDCFVKTSEPRPSVERLCGASVYPLDTPVGGDYDVYLAWNEPDYLRELPEGALKVCSQQLNDFTYAAPGFDDNVDVYAMPSEVQRRYVVSVTKVAAEKTTVVPNSINLEFFDETAEKRPASIAYCSSPDRGLHRLLEIFPHVRKRVPHAKLSIFYRFWPWYEQVKTFGSGDHIGRRARYIKECLVRLGMQGENGVHLVGPIPTRSMARELSRTRLLVYPCDPVRFTEGFSISIMDGCASRCLPVISDADALGDIYRNAVTIIPGRPGRKIEEWADTVSGLLLDETERSRRAGVARKFAEGFSRQVVSEMWERLFVEQIARKGKRTA